MQKSSFLNILRAIRAGRCRERRCADHIFIQIYCKMHHFVVKFSKFSSPRVARGHWPANQNPADPPCNLVHVLSIDAGDICRSFAIERFYTKSTPWLKKKTLNSCLQLPQTLTDFQNSFTDWLSDKFATNSCLNIPPHTLNMLLHYLVKYEIQKTGGDLKCVLWLMINHKVI